LPVTQPVLVIDKSPVVMKPRLRRSPFVSDGALIGERARVHWGS